MYDHPEPSYYPSTIEHQVSQFHALLTTNLGHDTVSPYTQSVKLAEEVDELAYEITHGEDDQARAELADVIIVSLVMAKSLGMSVEDVLEKVHGKMNINLNRRWSVSSTGAAHHDKEI